MAFHGYSAYRHTFRFRLSVGYASMNFDPLPTWWLLKTSSSSSIHAPTQKFFSGGGGGGGGEGGSRQGWVRQVFSFYHFKTHTLENQGGP